MQKPLPNPPFLPPEFRIFSLLDYESENEKKSLGSCAFLLVWPAAVARACPTWSLRKQMRKKMWGNRFDFPCWRQIWRVAWSESGSPELLGSPRTSPEVPRTSPEFFGDLPRKFSHCGTYQQSRGSLEVSQTSPEVPRTSPEVPETSPEVSPFPWEA